jgi:hypothetical protein
VRRSSRVGQHALACRINHAKSVIDNVWNRRSRNFGPWDRKRDGLFSRLIDAIDLRFRLGLIVRLPLDRSEAGSTIAKRPDSRLAFCQYLNTSASTSCRDGQKHDFGSWKSAFLTAFLSRVTNSDTSLQLKLLTRVSTPHRSYSLAVDEKTRMGSWESATMESQNRCSSLHLPVLKILEGQDRGIHLTRSDICRQTQFWRFDQTLFELFFAEPVVLRSPSISTHHSTMTSK